LTIGSEKIKELVLTSNCDSQKKSKQIVKELTLNCWVVVGSLMKLEISLNFFLKSQKWWLFHFDLKYE
jgi:hypothetical protein